MTPLVLVTPRVRRFGWMLVAAVAAAGLFVATRPAPRSEPSYRSHCRMRAVQLAAVETPPLEADCRAALAARHRAEAEQDARGVMSDEARAALADRVLRSCVSPSGRRHGHGGPHGHRGPHGHGAPHGR